MPNITNEETAVVEIELARHNSFVFYNRRENGRTVVAEQRIPLDRARQIYDANQGNEWQQANGSIGFDTTPAGDWLWTTRIAL